MTSKPDTAAGDLARSRRYGLEFWSGMALYVVATVAAATFGDLRGDGPGRIFWALLPVLPCLWLLVAFVRHFRRIDEYQQHLALTGLAAGFGAAMLAAVTFGWLSVAGFTLTSAPWLIFGVGMAAWGLAGIWAGRR